MSESGMIQFEGMETGYNRDTAMQAEFGAHPTAAMSEIKSNLGPVKEILNHPDMAQLVGESRITQMLEYDLGEGVRLGDSKIDPDGSGRCRPKDRAPARPGLWRNPSARPADGQPRAGACLPAREPIHHQGGTDERSGRVHSKNRREFARLVEVKPKTAAQPQRRRRDGELHCKH